MKILLVEDNDSLAELLTGSLKRAGFVIDHVGLAEDARAALSTTRYNAVVLDLGLPDEDGLSVLSFMRDRGDSAAVLILTSRDGLGDRVTGLNKGADDYLVKPFEMDELVARLRALLRRPESALHVVQNIGNLQFNTLTREVMVAGCPVSLTRRECDVLEFLFRRMGKVVTKTMLEDELYGFNETVGSNSVEVAVHRLRKTLADAGASSRVHTLRGIGYILSDAAV